MTLKKTKLSKEPPYSVLHTVTNERPFLRIEMVSESELTEAQVIAKYFEGRETTKEDAILEALLYNPYLYINHWNTLVDSLPEPEVGESYNEHTFLKLKDPAVKDTHENSSLCFIKFLKPTTVTPELSTVAGLKNYFDNGLVEIFKYQDIERKN